MKVIFENEVIKISKTDKNYDFIAVVENKTDKKAKIRFFDDEVENIIIEPNDWVGLLADEEGYLVLTELETERFDVI